MALNWNLALQQSGTEALDAMKAFEMGRQTTIARNEQKRMEEARRAAGDYVLATRQGGPAGPTTASVDRAGMGGSPTASSPNLQQLVQAGLSTQQDAGGAFGRLAQLDPDRALAMESGERKARKEQLDLEHQLNNSAINMLARARDQQSYDVMKARAAQLYGQHGVDIGSFNLPDQYDPDVMHGLLLSALDTDKRLAAERGSKRLEWDIEDDQLDNDRADRNTDSVISDRSARRDITVRGQNLTDARGRRGQDISSTDRRYSTDTSSRDRRYVADQTDTRIRAGYGTGGKRTRAAAPSLPVMNTPEEAMRLPSGTRFQTKDGQVKVRP
ncbi:MAG: hypothetical protein ABW184_09905 [Sphingobium sp.]